MVKQMARWKSRIHNSRSNSLLYNAIHDFLTRRFPGAIIPTKKAA
jgi:hypothetical protein